MAQTLKSAQKPGLFARMGTYFKNVRTELRRVVWPSRPEVLASSLIVLVTLAFFMLFTFVVDGISTEFVKLVSSLKVGG
jgi:preprotein translocase subunit SecE